MGLGHVISSWVGTGQNPPISPEQLQQVLGQGQTGQNAQSLGLQRDQVATQLQQLLPRGVDQVTPIGQMLAEGIDHSDVMDALSGMLGSWAVGQAARRNTNSDRLIAFSARTLQPCPSSRDFYAKIHT